MVWWAYSSCKNKSHGAKGRGFESPGRLSFERRMYRFFEKQRTIQPRSELKKCVKREDQRQTAKAIETGMVTRNGSVRFEDD